MKVKSGKRDLCFLVGHSFHFELNARIVRFNAICNRRYLCIYMCDNAQRQSYPIIWKLLLEWINNWFMSEVGTNSFTRKKHVNRNETCVLCFMHKIKDSCRIVSISFTNAHVLANMCLFFLYIQSMWKRCVMSQFNQLHASATSWPTHQFFLMSMPMAGMLIYNTLIMLTPDSE